MRKPLHIGGVLRCCIASLDEYEEGPDEEGTVLPCNFCSSALHVVDGAWRWHRDYVAPGTT